MDGYAACVSWRHQLIVSLWHKVVVCLCLFNLHRTKKRKARECCGVWCLCVLKAPCRHLSVYTQMCVCGARCFYSGMYHCRAHCGMISGKILSHLTQPGHRLIPFSIYTRLTPPPNRNSCYSSSLSKYIQKASCLCLFAPSCLHAVTKLDKFFSLSYC